MRFSAVILLCSICLSVSSCSKVKKEDDADAFVGTYNISVIENSVWGNDSGTINDKGTLIISKVSATKVRLYGFISTLGEVTGNNIYLEAEHNSDSAGYIDVAYGPGTLSGNVLTFTSNMTGKLRSPSSGILYPFRANSYFTAIKQY